MPKTMLIDATHLEETRVVVSQDKQLVDFDFETSTKRQLKGNIYLAKVTRVEPSLQAAFVDYGGNRHGFLAFSEIHSDYYQIPQADRELLEESEPEEQAEPADESSDLDNNNDEESSSEENPESTEAEPAADENPTAGEISDGDMDENGDHEDGDDAEPAEEAMEDAAEDPDEQARRRARLLRSYKIQEVIKRRQILLVQVVKEERGNKGAALTTYLSLPGRYCVLMPNTPRGGGISRKISNPVDRKRLKAVVQGLDVPQGIGLIVRTAGQQRSKAEIKRDYDFLLRQWNEIRDLTLNSIAPALIYEEGDLIKRAMRDLYTRDIDEVLVEGDEGYKQARRLMQMMMPSRARRVKQYKDELPLFFSYGIEEQLDDMYSPTVQLPSGGSIVIHTTEALTAIDVNSGRSTRERHIDETAVKTNIEAAEEISRQMRLRDLAGLIVVDFIDMSEMRHQRQVERRLRDAVSTDRARLQLGKISMFGLLEMSRQRLRPSLQELSSQLCPTCSGLGVIRSTESCALHALRLVQGEGIKNEVAVFQVTLPSEVAFYLLNHKRDLLVKLEERYNMRVLVVPDSEMLPPNFEMDVIEPRREEEADAEADDDKDKSGSETEATPEDTEEAASKKRRRRRRRRKRSGDEAETTENTEANDNVEADATEQQADSEPADAAAKSEEQPDQDQRRRRRRRRRRSSDHDSRGASSGERKKSEEDPATKVSPDVAAAIVAEIMAATGADDDESDPQPIQGEVPALPQELTEPSATAEEKVAPSEPAESAVELIEAPSMEPPFIEAENTEPPPEPEPILEEQPAQAEDPKPEPAMALAENGPEEPEDKGPPRQGWWSRWVR